MRAHIFFFLKKLFLAGSGGACLRFFDFDDDDDDDDDDDFDDDFFDDDFADFFDGRLVSRSSTSRRCARMRSLRDFSLSSIDAFFSNASQSASSSLPLISSLSSSLLDQSSLGRNGKMENGKKSE
jgi:hypothetical protein